MADVPNTDGVPPLPSYSDEAPDDLMTQDDVQGYGVGLSPMWGFYLGGAPAIVAESVVAMGFRQDWAISKYPIERGGFESFDRVDQPYNIKVQFASGSNSETRRELLASLAAATATGNTTKYGVVTPDVVYTGVSIEHMDYDRKAASGANLLLVDVWAQEVREQNTNPEETGDPSASSQQSNGTVQPSDVPLPRPNPLRSNQADFAVT